MTLTTHRKSKLAYALQHAKRGRKLVPCHGIVPGGGCTCREGAKCHSPGKHPRIRTGKDHLTAATDDLDRIREWWERWPDANIGVVTGAASGLIVVDVDNPAAFAQLNGALPDTYTVCSHGDHLHLYYRHPGHEVRLDSEGKIAPGIHFRGDGGLVIAAGSTHASGDAYAVTNARAPVKASDSLLRLLSRPSTRNGSEPVRSNDMEPEDGRSAGSRSRHDRNKEVIVAMRMAGATTADITAVVRKLSKRYDPPLPADRIEDELRMVEESANWRLGHEAKLAQEVEKLRIRDEAKAIRARERVGATFELPAAGLTMAEFLKEPRTDQKYTVDRLHTKGGNTLLVASYKTGKTVLLLNLARALADGTPFLDQFDVAPLEGRVAISNYELTRDMIHEWAEDHGVEHPERIAYPLNMRGRGRALPLWDDDVMERVVAWLKANDVQFWIIDPAARAWRGLVESEGDNVQIDLFTSALDEIKEAAGVEDLILSAHMGRAKHDEGEEHARGGTRLEDWMDHGWYMGRDGKDQDSPRWFRAMGRDVDVEAQSLDWDPTRRRIRWSGQSRADRREDSGVERILNALFLAEAKEQNELKSRELQEATGFTGDTIAKPRDAAERKGLITTRLGPRNSTLHMLTDEGRRRMTDHRVVVGGEDPTTGG